MESPPSLCSEVPSSLSPSPLPQVARQFPEPMPVALKVRLGTTPVATLRTNNATIQLQPFVEVQAVASNSAFQSLFSFDVVSEVGWWGWPEGWRLPRSHFLPHFPHLLYAHWSSWCSFTIP